MAGDIVYVILVYDVNEKRVGKVLKKCRQYLNWVQNSVLEGEISDANYTKLTMELNKIINNEEDSVIIYNLRTTKYSTRQILGHERASTSTII
ncbi:CRISPR-associated endonuclease Cas2 [Methylomusa anaerophila]|nr:CRISPR-associated endonuclease Cas2 [Methylomusa anaerophila]